MKIALFVHNFPPEFTGGTEQVVGALARAFQDLGEGVLVVAGSEHFTQGGKVEEERWEGVRVLRVLRDPSETYGLDHGYPLTGSRISDILATEKVDAVHVHHWSTLGWDILRRAAGLGVHGGVTIHDLWLTCPRFFRRPPPGVRCPTGAGRDNCVGCMQKDLPDASGESVRAALAQRDEMVRRELSVARFLAVPSGATARLIAKHLPWDGTFEVIPHGLLHHPQKRPSRDRNGPVRVGSFGNLVPAKGLDLLLEALANLGEEVELRLSGRLPEPAYLVRLETRAQELSIPFVWTGAYGPADPHPAEQLDLAVFPSLCNESYGLVVEEALARGVPVVVSARGALPERARRGGVVVRSGGILPLHIALARLLRSKKSLQTLGDDIPDEFPGIAQAASRYRELLLPTEVVQ